MMRFSYLILALGLCSCRASFVTKGEAVIISSGLNKADILDLGRMKLLRSELLYADSAVRAHQINFSEGAALLSVALPRYDFSGGHLGLHNTSKPGGALVIPLKKPRKKLWINVPDANYNAIINQEGTALWTAGYSHSGRVYVYSLPDGVLMHSIPVDPDPSGVVFSADQKYALVACGESSFVNVISTETYKVFKNIKVDPYPAHVWHGYENIFFVANPLRKSLNIIDLDQMKVISYIDFDFEPGFMKYNAKTEEIWVADARQPVLHLYARNDKLKWERVRQLSTGSPLHRFEFFQNYKKLLGVSLTDDSALILDCQKPEVLQKIAVSPKPNGIMIF